MLKKILVPVDGTPEAERVLGCLPPFVDALPGVRIAFLTVVDDGRNGLDALSQASERNLRQAATESAERYLDGLADRVRAELGDTSATVALGQPADEIRRMAAREGADLVALQPHRGSALARGILGSVTDNLLRTSPVPVLVTPSPRDHAGESTPWRPAAVVVPLDGSSLAEGALPLARGLAAAFDVAIVLVRGVRVPMPSEAESLAGDSEEAASTLRQEEQNATEYLQGVAAGPGEDGLQVRIEVIAAPGAQAVAAVIERTPGALVVMVSHGRSGLQRLILGSVMDKVVRADIAPVIVIPARVTPRDHALGELLASDMMSSPAVTIDSDATVGDAARLMLDRNIGCLPVVDADANMVGLITEGQVVPRELHIPFTRETILTVFDHAVGDLANLEGALREASSLPLREAMFEQRPSVEEDTPLGDVASFMIREECTHVPVLRGSKVVGVIARHDLLRLMTAD